MEVDIWVKLESTEDFIDVAYACLDLKNVHPELVGYEEKYPDIISALERGAFPQDIERLSSCCLELHWFTAGDVYHKISKIVDHFRQFPGVHVSARYEDDEGNSASCAWVDGRLVWSGPRE